MNTLSHSEVNNKGTAFPVSLSIRCLLNLTISSAGVSSFLSTSSFVLLEQRGLHVYHELTVCVYVADHSSTVLLVKLFGQLNNQNYLTSYNQRFLSLVNRLPKQYLGRLQQIYMHAKNKENRRNSYTTVAYTVQTHIKSSEDFLVHLGQICDHAVNTNKQVIVMEDTNIDKRKDSQGNTRLNNILQQHNLNLKQLASTMITIYNKHHHCLLYHKSKQCHGESIGKHHLRPSWGGLHH